MKEAFLGENAYQGKKCSQESEFYENWKKLPKRPPWAEIGGSKVQKGGIFSIIFNFATPWWAWVNQNMGMLYTK